MARYLGATWTREGLRSLVGDMAQLAGARSSVLADGKAEGVRAVEVYTGQRLRLHRAPRPRDGHPLRQLQGDVALVPLGHGRHPPRLLRGAGRRVAARVLRGPPHHLRHLQRGSPEHGPGQGVRPPRPVQQRGGRGPLRAAGVGGRRVPHPALGHGAGSVGDAGAPGAHPHLRDAARRPGIPPARRGGEPGVRGAAADAALPLQLRLPPARCGRAHRGPDPGHDPPHRGGPQGPGRRGVPRDRRAGGRLPGEGLLPRSRRRRRGTHVRGAGEPRRGGRCDRSPSWSGSR